MQLLRGNLIETPSTQFVRNVFQTQDVFADGPSPSAPLTPATYSPSPAVPSSSPADNSLLALAQPAAFTSEPPSDGASPAPAFSSTPTDAPDTSQ